MKISDRTITEIKNRLKDFMDSHFKKNSGYMYFNPFNKNGNEATPSLAFNTKDITQCTDFFNNTHYDIISLYAKLNNLDTKADYIKIIESLAKELNIKIDYEDTNETIKKTYNPSELKKNISENITDNKQNNFLEYYKKLGNIYDYTEATEYLSSRKITQKSIDKHNILYDNYKKQIIIPISDNYYKARTIDNEKIKKYGAHYNPSGSTPELFNKDLLFNSNKETAIFITESITDSLSLEETNENIKTIALNSTANYKKFIDIVKDSEYKGFFILCLDSDDTGIKTSIEIKKELEKNNIFSYIVNDRAEAYGGEWITTEPNIKDLSIKDLNELFIKSDIKDYAIFILNIITSAKEEYKKYIYKDLTPTSEYINTLQKEIKESTTYKPIKTNIDILDKALNGGFFAKQIITLIADTSLGKTALTLQIADKIAQNNPVLYFSLEMSQAELIARSISRIMSEWEPSDPTQLHKNIYSQLDILQGKQFKNLEDLRFYNEAIEEYKNQVKDNLIIYECIDNNTITEIENKINNYIAKTNNKPVIFIDYLQYIDPDIKGGITDKQASDKIIRVLKKIARSQAVNIFIISSTARGNYNQETIISSAKNSGDIEYTSDIVLGLNLEAVKDTTTNKSGKLSKESQENIKKASKKEIRDLYLTILKNRNGKRGIDIKNIKYKPQINKYDFSDSYIE